MALRCDAGAEAALRVCVPLRGGNAEAGLRVREHQHGMLLAVENCAKTCIQYPQRGRAF